MNLDASLYLKWIEAGNQTLEGQTFCLTNLCTLVGRTVDEKIKGITVFEPKDFSEAFLTRLEQRRQREEFADLEFTLHLPAFLKHRADTLLAAKGVEYLEIRYTPYVHIKQHGGRFVVREKLRVVSVDDSPVLLKFLKKAMDELDFIDIVAQISDPFKAVETIEKFKPDVVTLDIQMPGKTGVEVLKELSSSNPYPVIMISSLNLEEGSLVFDALNNGAFDYLQKPKLEDLKNFKEELSQKLLLAVAGREKHSALQKLSRRSSLAAPATYPSNLIWCLGASTGGTQALTRVFTSMPAKIPPTLIVQHIPPVFSRAFADSLNQLCPFTVKEAEDGDIVLPDHVYIAPGGIQMGVEKNQGRLCISLKDAPPVNRFKPSVDYLFLSIAKIDGLRIVAAILTGMGRDGAQGLLDLKKYGAQTLAQDEASSTVYGMPRAAHEIGATDRSVPLDEIAHSLLTTSTHAKKAS